MDNFLLSDMYSPTKLKAKLNTLIAWLQSTFASETELTKLWKYTKKNRKIAKAAL